MIAGIVQFLVLKKYIFITFYKFQRRELLFHVKSTNSLLVYTRLKGVLPMKKSVSNDRVFPMQQGVFPMTKTVFPMTPGVFPMTKIAFPMPKGVFPMPMLSL
uniref:Uncharacterized protein n=1 Tax=Cacopsylla melanoneura TaxID=428564 RepID=A0A8D8TL80_9HEMI